MDRESEKRTIMVVFGTRPEAIKMCPVVKGLKKHGDIRTIVVVTGQHRQMLDQVLDAFEVVPDRDLAIMREKQDLFDITDAVMRGMKKAFEEYKPDMVMVHGDTTTAFATALTAYYMGIKVAHVEAGLRTYNIRSPYPEEFNRQAVGIISDFNFAPTETARENLIREGKDPNSVWVTGNTVIDALKTTVKEDYSHPVLEDCKGKRVVLITVHRRENLGKPMRRIFTAIRRVVDEHEDVVVIYPVHLNPKVREIAKAVFDGHERIRLTEPLDVIDFHNFINTSYLVLTDSGGIQEEAPSLGKPVLVLRDTTERPEGIAAGTVKLAGTDEESVYREFTRLLDDESEYMRMANAVNPYGDGKAAERIAEILCLPSFGDFIFSC